MKITKRILELKNILEKCNPKSVFDIGCRDCIVKEIYFGEYLGLDLFQNKHASVDVVSSFESFDTDRKFEMVIAFDVLEHMDNPQHQIRRMFEYSSKYVAVSLPNTFDLLHTLRFLCKSKLSNKYIFHPKDVLDRHRWVVSLIDIEKFAKFLASELNCKYSFYYTFYFSDASNMIKKFIGRLLFILLPKRWIVINCVILFEKQE